MLAVALLRRAIRWIELVSELRKYHRDHKGSGKIVKRDDHLMDATRYLIISGRPRMHTQPQPPRPVLGPLLTAVRYGCKEPRERRE